MKKYLLILLIATVIVPSVAFASWWNPLTWFNNWSFHKEVKEAVQGNKEIPNEDITPGLETTSEVQSQSNSEGKIENFDHNSNEVEKLKKEIENLKNQNISNNVILDKNNDENMITKDTNQIPESINNSTESDKTKRPLLKDNNNLDITKYEILSVDDYIKNYKIYFNKPICIINGKIIAFNQGNNNYIEIVDYNNSSKSIEFNVESDNDYKKILDKLELGNRLVIFGFGDKGVKFNLVNNGKFDITDNEESFNSYEPTIKLDAIYKCGPTSPCQQAANANKIFQIKSISF